MAALFHPHLVNGREGDPALFVDLEFGRRALLFDMGDLGALDSRQIRRITDGFISHAHLDHFIGFDRLLRTRLGIGGHIRLFGPAGFIARVESRLAGYSWNLAPTGDTDLVFEATELEMPELRRTARLSMRGGFRAGPIETCPVKDGILFEDETLRVRAAILDHAIPCLAYAMEEPVHINVWRNKLEEMGLAVGGWIDEVKRAVRAGAPDGTMVRATALSGGGERSVALGRLKRAALRIMPGQKIAYVVDARPSDDNAARIVSLARDADILFIEAPFAAADGDLARERNHLTTTLAGRLAREAHVRRIEPFHFSKRYEDDPGRLRQEVADAAITGGENLQGRRRG